MKSLMLLWKWVAYESATWCNTSATRDYKTVTSRCEHEGLSFLTITLPNFGKDFEKSLDWKRVDHSSFTGFERTKGLPRFLGGFLDRVFDRDSGVLLEYPDKRAIQAVRQLTLMFGKIALPCTDARERNAMSGYVQCEKEVREADANLSSANVADFRRVASLLFREAFTEVDRKIYYGEVVPKHGPGSTADRLRGNAKYRLRTWTDRLEEVFPGREFLLCNWSFYDESDDIDHLEPGSEIPVKVISVPKTQKTPRIIAMEPTAMQYAQQGLLEILLEALGATKVNRNSPRFLPEFLGFLDQTPNQRMAQEGSLSRDLATLDMSEASDRVSNQLVREMVAPWPNLHKALDATRSRKADVPGHGVLRLAKYASMGSALCFPVEAMVFLTLIFLGIERKARTSLSRKVIYDYVGRVRVYGDDLIVPTDCVESVYNVLETFGSRVNVGKSFWNGKFRESCGKEYYDGTDISIVRCRRTFPTRRTDAAELISLVKMRNQLFEAGYLDTCEKLDAEVLKVISHYPRVASTSPALGRLTHGPLDRDGYDKHLQRPVVRGYVDVSTLPVDTLDGHGALLKWFLKRGEAPLSPDHLIRSGRASVVRIKPRMVSPV